MTDAPQKAPQESSASTSPSVAEAPIFGGRPQERGGLSPAVWGVAALIVAAGLGIFFYAGRSKAPPAPTTLQPPDAYASSLPLSQLAMSESANLSGGKLTYLDGRLQNTGSRTVTSATVQVVFENDEAMPTQIDTVPLTVVRMTQPYIDTEPVGADPLKPGDDRAFRLAFDSVPENWNQQMPVVRIIRTELR